MSPAERLELLRTIAKQNGGRCLSRRFLGVRNKYRFVCRSDHRWEARYDSIISGKWCKKCSLKIAAEKLRTDPKIAVKKIKARGGTLLESDLKDGTTWLRIECSAGHSWWANAQKIRAGSWCSECANEQKRLGLPLMKLIVQEHGGRCLSKRNSSAKATLNWECKFGHCWSASPDSIRSGSWCPRCAGKVVCLEDLQETAKSRGGEYLEQTVIPSRHIATWKCKLGHIFKKQVNNVRSGGWCPICSTSMGEKFARVAFNTIFGCLFDKKRPKWLLNNRGQQMELDGYNPKKRIAFEHQGEQHYSLKTHFINDTEMLKQRQLDDRRKERLCLEHGVRLFLVPEVGVRLKRDDLKTYVLEMARTFGMRSFRSDVEIDYNSAYLMIEADDLLEECHRLATARGGSCLDTSYFGSEAKVDFECAEGHQFSMRIGNLRKGNWCRRCSTKKKSDAKRHSIERCQEAAQALGGRCLDRIYIDSRTKLRWVCSEGHEWCAIPSSVLQGHWCTVCAAVERGKRRRIGIDKMRQVARERGGECLSDNYINANTKLKWRCANGHEWEAIPNSVVNRRTWCKKCRTTKKSRTASY